MRRSQGITSFTNENKFYTIPRSKVKNSQILFIINAAKVSLFKVFEFSKNTKSSSQLLFSLPIKIQKKFHFIRGPFIEMLKIISDFSFM
jgi:hypothetical protein